MKVPTNTRDTVEEFWNESILINCLKEGKKTDPIDFSVAIAKYLDVSSGKVFLTRSAGVALEKILLNISDNKKDTVLISSFNCTVIADAILKADLKVDTFDLADQRGRIDWEQVASLLTDRHAAIVIPHLFGVPTDFRPILEPARKLGIWVIEDCAHAFGSKIDGKMVGTLGDAALFSFNYDKPLSLGGGGALVIPTKSSLCNKLNLNLKQDIGSFDVDQKELINFQKFLKIRRSEIGKYLNFSSRVVRFAYRRLMSKKNQPIISAGIGPIRAALGIWQLKQYQHVMMKRNRNATLFDEDSYCVSWYVGPTVEPCWLKQKVMVSNLGTVHRISTYLQKKGLRVGVFNWGTTIDGYLGKKPEWPNARYVAQHGLDIPIHQNMLPEQCAEIKDLICSISKV
jgi:dTDP-4-amino-4,6-dideoxygalactose transaminase